MGARWRRGRDGRQPVGAIKFTPQNSVDVRGACTISSPGRQPCDSVRAKSKVSAVMLRPKTIPAASAPRRSAIACRAHVTAHSARRSASVIVPRFATGPERKAVIASQTMRGVCVPPGPSKWAAPASSEGKQERIRSTSNGMCGCVSVGVTWWTLQRLECEVDPVGNACAVTVTVGGISSNWVKARQLD